MASFQELSRLDGRVAIVTGGAGHLGTTIVDALLELGAEVYLLDIHERDAERVATERDRCHALVADVAIDEDVQTAVRKVLADRQRIDVLVHAAAYVGTNTRPGWAAPFTEQSTEAWDAGLRVNVTSVLPMIQEALPGLNASGHGSVILISSIYGLVGPTPSLYAGTEMHHPAAYGVSKAGLLQFGRFLATTLAPSVRVNCLTPGGIARNQPNTFVERYVERTPLQRMAVEDDFKGAIGFLASDLSQYVTGHNLVVDGGWTAW